MDEPTTIIGHERLVGYLERVHREGRVAHAYLLVGPTSVGKSTVAEWFARLLLNLPPSMPLMHHVDALTVTKSADKKNIGVEEIRETILTPLTQTSLSGGYRVAVVSDAHELSSEAAAALLKTLEEPPSHVVIILAAPTTSSLPATVVSRCQVLSLSPVGRPALALWLQRERGVSAERADLLSRLASGLPGRAVRLLSTDETLEERNRSSSIFLRAIDERQVASRFALFGVLRAGGKTFAAAGNELKTMVAVWRSLCRDLLLLGLGQHGSVVNVDHQVELVHSAALHDFSFARARLLDLDRLEAQLQWNVSPQLALESFLTSWY